MSAMQDTHTITAPNVGDDVRQWFGRFVSTLNPSDLDLFTLWAVHAHVVTQLYTTPRLLIASPVPGSGKTTVLEHLERLCPDPLNIAVLSSAALLPRMLQAGPHTVLLDEIDKNLRPDRPDAGDIFAVLNSGYKRGGNRPTLMPDGKGGYVAKKLPTYAPVAMAGLNEKPLPTDTLTRTIVVVLLPDDDGAVEDSDWEHIEDEAGAIRDQVAKWAHGVTLPSESLPPGLKGRAKERWRPLWRVAHALGGDWPQRCRTLIELDLERIEAEQEEGGARETPSVKLLRHVLEQWPPGFDHWRADLIAQCLRERMPSDWGGTEEYPKGLTAQRVGRYLAMFGLRSQRGSSETARLGYRLGDVRGAARRLGLSIPQPKPIQTTITIPDTLPAWDRN